MPTMNIITRKALSIGFAAAVGSALVLSAVSPAMASVHHTTSVKAAVAKTATTRVAHYQFNEGCDNPFGGGQETCDVENTGGTRHGFAIGSGTAFTAYRGVVGSPTRTLGVYTTADKAIAAIEKSINSSVD